ncbi:hypothetical protein M8J77_014736 [Diaphorina citri]|nr:hypothetical protein M8J77_014736 [Diaphorina citri]
MTGPTTVCILLLGVAALTQAQVPGFGGCPDFVAMPDFDMSRFLGTWYETERYVNIFEAGSRCVKTNYTKAVDGRFLVASEIMNRFTGVKRVLEGEIKLIVKGTKSELNVRYPNLPIPYDTQYTVLDTNYDEYAVVWSCSSLGIVNTQNAWILTREKLPSGTALQKAYGVLDKYKLSRYFFSKTDQNDCYIAEAANENNAVDSDGNDAVEQTADGVYKNADASASPVANPEASPVANASPAAEAAPVVPAEQPAPVVVASDAAAAPVAQANPVPAPSASPEEESASQKYESASQKYESPVVQSAPAESSPAVDASKSESQPQQQSKNVVSPVEAQPLSHEKKPAPVKETVVKSAPLSKSHHKHSARAARAHHHKSQY